MTDLRYAESVGWLAEGLSQAQIRDRLAGKRVTGGRLLQDLNARIGAVLQALALNAMYTQSSADHEGGEP